MKPAYWIGVMAVVGAMIGYILSTSTGWFGTGIGTVLGILVGVIVYTRLKDKQKTKP